MKKTALLFILTIIAFAMLSTCKKEAEIEIELPAISTLEVTEIKINSAKSGGNISNDGGGEILERGVVWSITQNPSMEVHIGITSDGTGTGTFQSDIADLSLNTTYYVRAYAKNSSGVAYGNQEQINTGLLPESDFLATPTTGPAPLTVNFTEQSTNTPISWQWDFGDGNTSTQQTPEHIYESEGSYTVQLTVTNSYGSYTEIKPNYITVKLGLGQPCPETPTVADIDGNIYNTVLIGDQCWMKENLRTTNYRNGISIEYPDENNASWQSNTTGAYAWYNNDINWKDKYGALYNWHAVNNINGLCPVGWHVPSDAEWTQLIDYVDGMGYPNQSYDPNGAGNALKSCRQENSPQEGGCNTSEHPRWNANEINYGFDAFGFSILPGGYRSVSIGFNEAGNYAPIWSSSSYSSTFAWFRSLLSHDGLVTRNYFNKANGYSVRCIRD